MTHGDHTHREIRMAISATKAKELLQRLADDDAFRARFKQEPRSILLDYRIDVSPETLPEEIELPAPDDIRALVKQAEEIIERTREAAEPFGYIVMFVVHGAMPVVPAPAG
jgi:putative modified peptide